MKLTQNQFFGKKDELAIDFTPGATYVSLDNGFESMYIFNELGKPVLIGSSNQSGSNLTLDAVTNNGINTKHGIVIDPLGTSSLDPGSVLSVKSKSSDVSNIFTSTFITERAPTEDAYFANTQGIFSSTRSNSSFRDGGIVGAQLQGKILGTGGAFYLYGSITDARHEGSGDVAFVVGNSIRAKHEGSGTGNVTQLRGLSSDSELNGSNKTCNFLQGHHNTVNLKAGTVTGSIAVNLLDFDYTSGVNQGDFAYLQIQSDLNGDFSFTQGNARAINSDSLLPSVFAGTLQAKELSISSVPTFANEAAAVSLSTGTIYATSTGELRIKL